MKLKMAEKNKNELSIVSVTTVNLDSSKPLPGEWKCINATHQRHNTMLPGRHLDWESRNMHIVSASRMKNHWPLDRKTNYSSPIKAQIFFSLHTVVRPIFAMGQETTN